MFRLVPPGLEPGTFRVLGERDNHYTTELLDSVNNIKKIKHILSHVLTRPTRFLELYVRGQGILIRPQEIRRYQSPWIIFRALKHSQNSQKCHFRNSRATKSRTFAKISLKIPSKITSALQLNDPIYTEKTP